jgi:hypothetical protein
MTQVWMHKTEGHIVLVNELFRFTKENFLGGELVGSWYQAIGYGIENCHGVICVFDYSVKEYFEYIGEWD